MQQPAMEWRMVLKCQDVDEVMDDPILELTDELLPLTRDNPAAVSLLRGLAGGHALDVHGQVSAALAVQVHRMFVGAAAATPLAGLGMQGAACTLRCGCCRSGARRRPSDQRRR